MLYNLVDLYIRNVWSESGHTLRFLPALEENPSSASGVDQQTVLLPLGLWSHGGFLHVKCYLLLHAVGVCFCRQIFLVRTLSPRQWAYLSRLLL